MNAQQAYDGIVAHFSTPDAEFGYVKSEDGERGECVYRGGSDPKSPVHCAVGCLIPDDAYTPEIENGTALSVKVSGFLRRSLDIDGDTLRFLAMAQECHDGTAAAGLDIATFLDRLAGRAKEYGLTVA